VEIAPGIWRWTARHPEWHPGEFGAEVGSYAVVTDDELLLADPLLPEPADAVLAALDALAGGRAVHVLITIGYHARSADALADRFDAEIWGPPRAASRLRDAARLTVLAPDEPGPGGAVAHAIGRPRRGERPLWLPSHAALAFGDAIVVTPQGELRVWVARPLDEGQLRRYRERFVPTLEPLLALGAERVLVTHGAPVVERGTEALDAALRADPWFLRG
jgi:glyoxylase-like metal-dependent hydrolase (beta-lactamase superfamily II)